MPVHAADLTDTNGDVSNSGIDVIQVQVSGNSIVLKMAAAVDYSNTAFLVLLSSDGDHNSWEAGIAVIGSAYPSVYWNIGDLCNGQWNLDSSKVVTNSAQLSINFVEFQELITADIAVLSIDASNSQDWVPDLASTYADFSVFYSVISSLTIPSGGAGMQCNYMNMDTSVSSLSSMTSNTSASISSTLTTSEPLQSSSTSSSSKNRFPLPFQLEPFVFGILVTVVILRKLRYNKEN